MIKPIKILFFSLLTCLVFNQAYAQLGQGGGAITTTVPFLQIAPDARSGGMGDVGAAISADANASYWNPAKVSKIQNDIGASISYSPWLNNLVDDMFLTYLTGYKKIDRLNAVSLSLLYFDLGNIPLIDENQMSLGDHDPQEWMIGATYSRVLSENLSIGFTGKFIHSNIGFSLSADQVQSASSVAGDVGIYYEKDLLLSGNNSNLALAAVISNIGAKMSYFNKETKDFIPTNLKLGTAFTTNLDPYNTITLALDFNKLLVPTPPIYQTDDNGDFVRDANGNLIVESGKDPDRSLLSGMFGSFGDAPDGFSEELQEVSISAGAEYWYNNLFAARAGYFYEHANKGNRKFFTLGLGFRYQVFGIDFAYLIPQEQNHPLSDTLRFTLHFNFDGDNSANSAVPE